MGIRIKRLSVLMILITVSTVILAACYNNSSQTDVDNIGLVEQKYDTVPFYNPQIRVENSAEQFMRQDIVLISSLEDLEQLNLTLDSQYDESFFVSKNLVLIQFTHADGEKVNHLTALAIKDDMLCPVITIDSQENLGTVIYYTLMSAEVKKTDSPTEVGDIMIINTFDKSQGSWKHNRFE